MNRKIFFKNCILISYLLNTVKWPSFLENILMRFTYFQSLLVLWENSTDAASPFWCRRLFWDTAFPCFCYLSSPLRLRQLEWGFLFQFTVFLHKTDETLGRWKSNSTSWSRSEFPVNAGLVRFQDKKSHPLVLPLLEDCCFIPEMWSRWLGSIVLKRCVWEYEAVDFYSPLNPAVSNRVYSQSPFLCLGQRAGNAAESSQLRCCAAVQMCIQG